MTTQLKKTYYTPAEYLALEKQSTYRSEYINGKIIRMPGGTTEHNEIVTNICVYLKPLLRKINAKIYLENVRLWIEYHKIYTYPDVMISENQPLYHSQGTSTITNPSIIFEVASKSTKNYDQGDKFDFYKSLPCLKEYVIVEQSKYHVIAYTKTIDGKWILSEYETQETALELTSLSLSIPLEEIYAGIDFNLEDEDLKINLFLLKLLTILFQQR